jgi:hypothetical protein
MTSTLEYSMLNTLVNKGQIIDVESNRNCLLPQLLSLHPTGHHLSHYLYGYEIWGKHRLLLT